MEIWKDIPGYEGYYQASNKGKIKSLLFQNNILNKKYSREKILKQKKDKYNSYRVELWKDGKSKTWLVHRLVGITFLGIPKENMTINHKDGNRLNNNVENLEWCTLKENINHGFRTGLYTFQIKTRVKNKKDNTVNEFISMAEASRYIGRNSGYISDKTNKGYYENELYCWELL